MKKRRIHQNWQFWKAGNEKEIQTIQLPHDAMIYEDRVPDMENGSSSGYYPGGLYYYEKKFWGKEEYKDQSVILEFEGVYMNSTIYLNGKKVGGWVYGYTNFFVDITEQIRIGEENDLLVKVDNSKTPNSRWYSGSGIYRPVNMWIGSLTHIKPQGLFVKTVSINPAVIELHTDYEADETNDVVVEYSVYDAEKNKVVSSEGKDVKIEIPNAKLWSAEAPNLYSVKVVLKVHGNMVDEAEESFGIRTLAWSTENGFQVNGKMIKLRGGCIHHDNGILGGCTYDKAEYRKIKRLKEFGFNAIRYSHYPAGKNLLDICDKLGMYVMEESFDQWRKSNTEYDYSIYFDEECEKDIAALARKDYNHPSVIMYCIGNEIVDTGLSYGTEITHRLCEILKKIDGTRPVAIANNAAMSIVASEVEKLDGESGIEIGSLEINELITENPELIRKFDKEEGGAAKLEHIVGKVFDELDIAGHNYAQDIYKELHEANPNRVLLGSETYPARMADNWKSVEKYDYLIGDFHWTAWDYLGEAGVGLPVYGTMEAPFVKPYPCLTAACGSFDLIGYPEAAAYYAAVIWEIYKKPYIGVRPVNHSGEEYTIGNWRLTDALDCWTWEGCEGRKAEVIVYSIGKQVELLRNGELVGRKDLTDWKAEFEVDYIPGKLEVISYDEAGKTIGRSILETAGSEVHLSVCPEETEVKADPEEIIFVPICVTDEEGAVRQMTDKKITVKVEGEGSILTIGSGRPETEEHFYGDSYTSWHGRILAVIRCSGKPGMIKVSASAQGCKSVSAEIRVKEA